MKKRYFIFSLLLLGILNSCKQNADITRFDTKNAFVAFAYPNTATPQEDYLDSINFNFSVDAALGVQEETIYIPVKIGGLASNNDRKFKVQIVSESDFDASLVEISEPVIRAGHYEDSLQVKIKKSPVLAKKQMSVVIELVPDENFKLGDVKRKRFKISFTDVLVMPRWWQRSWWQAYFGPYRKEVYQKWIEIYPEGIDPTGYSWKNMPYYPSMTTVPVTIAYIGVLKAFFIENNIYPDGDTSKPKILLP